MKKYYLTFFTLVVLILSFSQFAIAEEVQYNPNGEVQTVFEVDVKVIPLYASSNRELAKLSSLFEEKDSQIKKAKTEEVVTDILRISKPITKITAQALNGSCININSVGDTAKSKLEKYSIKVYPFLNSDNTITVHYDIKFSYKGKDVVGPDGQSVPETSTQTLSSDSRVINQEPVWVIFPAIDDKENEILITFTPKIISGDVFSIRLANEARK